MFQNICKRIFAKSHTSDLLMVRHGYCTQSYKRPSEMNIVRMSGTIEGAIERLPSRGINFYLKTLHENSGYSVHKVVIANRQMLKIVGNKLEPNQRVHISGRLNSVAVEIENERIKNFEIMAHEIFKLDPIPELTKETVKNLKEIPPFQMDQNYVEMMGFIGSTPKIFDRSCKFYLKTHFTRRSGTPEECEAEEYHNVYIDKSDPNLLQMAKQLQKSDRVYLHGRINYVKQTLQDKNEPAVIGFIQPTNMVRIKKITKEPNPS